MGVCGEAVRSRREHGCSPDYLTELYGLCYYGQENKDQRGKNNQAILVLSCQVISYEKLMFGKCSIGRIGDFFSYVAACLVYGGSLQW